MGRLARRPHLRAPRDRDPLAPDRLAGWPDGEHGGINLESQILLSNRDALEEIEDVDERAAACQRMIDEAYERGSALNLAAVFGTDDVIDPAETRRWIADGLKSVPQSEPIRPGRYKFLDTW